MRINIIAIFVRNKEFWSALLGYKIEEERKVVFPCE